VVVFLLFVMLLSLLIKSPLVRESVEDTGSEGAPAEYLTVELAPQSLPAIPEELAYVDRCRRH
jgi:hypothetical protein